jgi:hypothetical protein
LPLLNDDNASPASRRLASARPALAPKCEVISAQALVIPLPYLALTSIMMLDWLCSPGLLIESIEGVNLRFNVGLFAATEKTTENPEKSFFSVFSVCFSSVA